MIDAVFKVVQRNLAGLALAALVLFVYMTTLAPDITFEHFGADGGDLTTASWTLGVPHPPGYPTYTLLGWFFARFPLESIAYRTNLMSAVFAACCVFFVFKIAQELQPDGERSLVIPVATSTILAFATLFWSQAVITEVYTLLAFFAAFVLWCLLRYRNGAGRWALWLAAILMGLGLGNHLSLVFILPATLVLLWSERQRWLRLRVITPLIGFFLLGLSVYIYLPLAASGEPPVNWGYITSWERFWWVVSARQYQAFVFALPGEDISGRIAEWGGVFSDQIGWWGLIISAVGIFAFWVRDRTYLYFSLVWAVPLLIYAFFYDTIDAYVFLLPLLILLAVWWGEGARLLILIGQEFTARRAKTDADRPLGVFWRWWPPFIVLLLPLASLTTHWREVDLSGDYSAPIYLTQILEDLPENSLVVTRRDRPTFGLWYQVYANEQRTDLALVNARMLAYLWYRDQTKARYPHITIPSPATVITADELARDLFMLNLEDHPVYATDPVEAWEAWFDFVPEGDVPVYRVRLK